MILGNILCVLHALLRPRLPQLRPAQPLLKQLWFYFERAHRLEYQKTYIKVTGSFLPTNWTVKFMSTDGQTEYTSLSIGKVVIVEIDLGRDLSDDMFMRISSCRNRF